MKFVIMLHTDMFEHSNGDSPIIGALQLSVVHMFKLDAVLYPECLGYGAGHADLFD